MDAAGALWVGTDYTLVVLPKGASVFHEAAARPLLAMAVMYGFARYGRPARFPLG